MATMIEISVIPIGKEGSGLSAPIAEMLKVAQRHGVKWELNPMGTCLEGDLETLLQVAREMHEVAFTLGYPRAVTTIKLDDRRDREVNMSQKLDAVLSKL